MSDIDIISNGRAVRSQQEVDALVPPSAGPAETHLDVEEENWRARLAELQEISAGIPRIKGLGRRHAIQGSILLLLIMATIFAILISTVGGGLSWFEGFSWSGWLSSWGGLA